MPEFQGRKTVPILEAALKCGVSSRTIYNWLRKGRIEHVRNASNHVLIFEDTLFRECNRYTPQRNHADTQR